MPLLYYVQNSVVGMLLVSIMLYYVLGQGGRRQAQDSLFVALLFCALFMVIVEFGIDLVSGRTFSGSRIILTFSVFGLYMGNPLLAALYLLYLDQLRKGWVRIPHGIGIAAFVPFALCFILCFLSLFNGKIFSIDAGNIYGRGPYFHVITLIAYGGMSVGFAYLLLFRDSFKHRDFSLFLFFPLPTIIGSLLQLMFFGIEVAGISLVLTLLVVYLQMQNSQASKDYLTSLYNRSLSEQYLKHLLNQRKSKKALAGILMDINNFKQVNDTYGHELGDRTLRYFSRLLIESFGNMWFIGRFGGDEFILLRDGAKQQDLEKDLARFHELLSRFNDKNILPFSCSVSIGSSLYEASVSQDGKGFIKTLDTLMYEAKRASKAHQNM